MGGIFGGGFGVRGAFDERRNEERSVRFAGREVPSALIDDFAVELLPGGDELRGIIEGENGAGDDGNVGAMNEFQHAKGVSDLFVAPLVSGDDGDAEDPG